MSFPCILLVGRSILINACRALDSAFPRDPSLSRGHLRRFSKRDQLPTPLKSAIDANGSFSSAPGQTIFVLVAPPLPDIDKLQGVLAPFAPAGPSTSQHTTETSPTPSTSETPPSKVGLLSIKVPIQPPFNAEQAERWTNTLWPVIFNPAAPRATVAPPPQTLNRTLDSIKPRAGYYLSLARRVAEESEQSGRGRGVGAVIVDPAIEAEIEAAAWENWQPVTERWMDAVVAVGGDARYARSEAGAPSQAELHRGMVPNPISETYNADLEGGPDLHALMRASELVARRRRQDPLHEAATADITPPAIIASDPQLSTKLSPLEHYFLYETDAQATAPPVSPLSPKKRKHEEANPETQAAPLEVNADTRPPAQSLTSSAPLPAPPPSTTALADPPIHTQSTEAAQSTHLSTGESASARISKIRTRSQGGYLCTDLDVYVSHEPCLCCSMGMLLSRFRAVIFPRRGRLKSGGLASEQVVKPVPASDNGECGHKVGQESHADNEPETRNTGDRLYYGLHWRKELNWRALGFEFVEDGLEDGKEYGNEGVVFHA